MKEKIKDIDTLKSENKELKKEINDLKNKINLLERKNIDNNNVKDKLEMDKSMIIKENEEDMIILEIEKRMNKQIKKLKKLYQATVDGGDSKNFHLKCDNIPNTLVLIKSEGERRFGGFTTIPWKSEEEFVMDSKMTTFVFSLDTKKIYNLKSINENAVYHCINSGPCFGNGRDIALDGNPIKENTLFTNKFSFDYQEDNQPLSEYYSYNRGKVVEYEVYQILFIVKNGRIFISNK